MLLFVAFVAIAAAADEVNSKVSAVRESPQPPSCTTAFHTPDHELPSWVGRSMLVDGICYYVGVVCGVWVCGCVGDVCLFAGLCVLPVGLQHRQHVHDRRRVAR